MTLAVIQKQEFWAITQPERTGGRYRCYPFHGDNPVTFTRYLKHNIEHGHANHRADNFYSCWYQAQPATGFPRMPAVAARTPVSTQLGDPAAQQAESTFSLPSGGPSHCSTAAAAGTDFAPSSNRVGSTH